MATIQRPTAQATDTEPEHEPVPTPVLASIVALMQHCTEHGTPLNGYFVPRHLIEAIADAMLAWSDPE